MKKLLKKYFVHIKFRLSYISLYFIYFSLDHRNYFAYFTRSKGNTIEILE